MAVRADSMNAVADCVVNTDAPTMRLPPRDGSTRRTASLTRSQYQPPTCCATQARKPSFGFDGVALRVLHGVGDDDRESPPLLELPVRLGVHRAGRRIVNGLINRGQSAGCAEVPLARPDRIQPDVEHTIAERRRIDITAEFYRRARVQAEPIQVVEQREFPTVVGRRATL